MGKKKKLKKEDRMFDDLESKRPQKNHVENSHKNKHWDDDYDDDFDNIDELDDYEYI